MSVSAEAIRIHRTGGVAMKVMLIVGFVGAVGGVAHVPHTRAGFEGRITGAVVSRVTGPATMGPVGRVTGAPAAFSIRLGEDTSRAAVLFTLVGDEPLKAGRYPIAEVPTGKAVLALITVGTADHPEGVFRVESGSLEIGMDAGGRMTGQFSLNAVGFLAAEPEREDREVVMTGSFVTE
jgi:hypothetical protein